MDSTVLALRTVIDLERIEKARLKKELAMTKRELSSLQYELADLELVLAETKSRTGEELFCLNSRSLTTYLEKFHGQPS